jgi:spore coat polysaccharide biosynthesis protein SpsF
VPNEQERFWAGEFGDAYTRRSQGDELLASKTAFLARALSRCGPIQSAIELGANTGLNLEALLRLLPDIELGAVEINETAATQLKRLPVEVRCQSLLDFEPDRAYDLAIVSGVLIHLAPDSLPNAYETLYAASNRYILIAEYYSPSPVGVLYRGHQERLFKRDFAGELLELHNDLTLHDYGFVYYRDANFAMDDVNWFLLEKRGQPSPER